jgi:hypothetical protein
MEEAMRQSLAVVALLAGACEPGWSVQGHVRDVGFAGVRGADVALSCPGQQDLAATTDQIGAFQLRGRGPGPALDCAIVVAAPAFVRSRFPLAQACEDAREDLPRRCEVALVNAVLSRR